MHARRPAALTAAAMSAVLVDLPLAGAPATATSRRPVATMLVRSRLDRKLSDWKDTTSGAVHSDREALLFSNLQKGSNQTAIRDYNERLILQLIRNHERLTKTEATRARHYLGLKVRRRSFDLVAIDFSGSVLADVHEFHKYPTPEPI